MSEVPFFYFLKFYYQLKNHFQHFEKLTFLDYFY